MYLSESEVYLHSYVLEQYKYEYSVITEFAPTFIDNPDLIAANIASLLEDNQIAAEKKNRGAIMKVIVANNWKAHFDMAVVNKVLGSMLV